MIHRISIEIQQSLDSSNLLAYALNDGTVGMYNDGIRLWRIKVQNIISNRFKM